MDITLPSALNSNAPSREYLLHALYEAAELEHTLMCTYLYAAFSLKGADEGLTGAQLEAVLRWRRELIDVAIEEMSHLTAVWNITAAIGGTPRFGRVNFPLSPGLLPAGVVVKLAPFNVATLQHFIFLERPDGSREPEGAGFAPEQLFTRALSQYRLTPIGLDYETVGAFYAALGDGLRRFVATLGEAAAFCGDQSLQLSANEINLTGATPVICLKTALAAFDAIVLQGEGAPAALAGSHFYRFVQIREEFDRLRQADPHFVPAHPAATNPVLRRPPQPEGRVWIEDEYAAATVDLANTCYSVMLRLLAYVYTLPSPSREKSSSIDISLQLMRAMTLFAESAARLPAGASNAKCNAGMSFTALRDASPLPTGIPARRFFIERLTEITAAAEALQRTRPLPRIADAIVILQRLVTLSQRAFDVNAPIQMTQHAALATHTAQAAQTPNALPASLKATNRSDAAMSTAPGIETVVGRALTLHFEAKRCIHARFCVTGAPNVFLANVKGAWLQPDAMDAERLVDIAHACPSGAIRYTRSAHNDHRPNEMPPPVNLLSVRESGPYAVRAPIALDGSALEATGFRATLCRCGASNNKPFCDGSHHTIEFAASGEPDTGIGGRNTDMLPARDGVLDIDPEVNGPLNVRGNIEILSGTGRMVCRVTAAKLCRCGGSASKPFCDGTHAKIGFKA
jgi:CDGSH-type Zn-finger protein/uncharacterized Fe-S cluster protein YjdI